MHVVTEKEKSLVGDRHIATSKVGLANWIQYNQERLDKG